MEDKDKRGSKKEWIELSEIERQEEDSTFPLVNNGGECEHILMFW